jgi:hypothetical protein
LHRIGLTPGTLRTSIIVDEHFKIHLSGLIPATFERLDDGKQPVREAVRQLLMTLMEVSPTAFHYL